MNPEQTDLHTVRLEVQQQGALVDALRQRFFAGVEITESGELWKTLQQAESRLLALMGNLYRLERLTSDGTIIETANNESAGTLMGRETTGLDVKIRLRMERIPTGIVHLLNASDHPLLTYEIENAAERAHRLRLTSYVEGYSALAVNTVEIPREGKVTISQLPTFFPNSLKQVSELCRATLHIKVDDLDGAQELHNTQPIWLLSRNSAYLSIKDPATGSLVDLSRYLAAWVTPHTEDIMQVLRTAADHHPECLMAGYQGDQAFVEGQVKAIYAALQEQKLTYINSIICFGQGYGEYMQRVRLPSESLRLRSANCIDGTVLFSSVLEATSLNPGIVLVPGHAFLAWQSQRGGEWDYLETTMIGSSDFEKAQNRGRSLARKFREMVKSAASNSFFRLLPVSEMRSNYGITPLE